MGPHKGSLALPPRLGEDPSPPFQCLADDNRSARPQCLSVPLVADSAGTEYRGKTILSGGRALNKPLHYNPHRPPTSTEFTCHVRFSSLFDPRLFDFWWLVWYDSLI